MPSWSAWMIARREARDLGRRGALGELLERVVAGLADPHLAERERELLRERAVHVLGQLRDRAVEAEAGLDGDGEQVERVGQLRRGSPRGACGARIETTKPGAMKPRQPSAIASRSAVVGPPSGAAEEQAEEAAASAPAPFSARNVVGVIVRPIPAASSRAEIESSVMRGLRRSTMPGERARRGQ